MGWGKVDGDMRACNRVKWTREEDDRLRRIIGKEGSGVGWVLGEEERETVGWC